MAPGGVPFVVTALVLVSVPATLSATFRATSPEDQIVLSGTVAVPRGREVGEVVVLHGSARIDGVAVGDVVVLDGPIEVGGQVSGSVVALNGSIRLGPNARVRGDVTARGLVTAADGARVDGGIRQHAAFTWRAPVSAFGRFATWLAVSISALLLGLLLVLLAPRAIDAAWLAASHGPWSSAAWGVGIAIAIPLAAVVAIASLVALPLGLALLLSLGLAALAAYVLTAYTLGHVVMGRLSFGRGAGRVVVLLVGWAILRLVALVPGVSGITFGLAAAFGAGAAAVATWRARAWGGRHREGRAQLSDAIREQAGL